MLSSILTVIKFIMQLLELGKQASFLYKKSNREKRLEILKDKTKNTDDKLNALRDLEL